MWGPLGLRVDFVVTEVDEQPPDLGLVGAARPAAAAAAARRRARPGRQRDLVAVRGPAPVVAAYLPVARLALHRLVR